MGFLKDFKADLLQAADELMPISEKTEDAEEVNLMEEDVKNEADLKETVEAETAKTDENEEMTDALVEEVDDTLKKQKTEEAVDEVPVAEEEVKEDTYEKACEPEKSVPVSDMEVTTISKGVHLEGNLNAEGSVNLLGDVVGNLTCAGKLVIDGTIKGNSKANEIYANGARVEGDIESKGSLKIGSGSVIIGNITASSAVIGGAVKGDIDVKGPVIIDSTAVVFGNIKSRSVQLNNGAVLDGFVSQCYAGVDVEALFNEKAAK